MLKSSAIDGAVRYLEQSDSTISSAARDACYLLDFDRCRHRVWLTEWLATNGDREGIIVCGRGVAQEVYHGNTCEVTFIVNRVYWLVRVLCNVYDLGLIRGSKRLRHCYNGIERRTNGPFVESGLAGGRG